MKTILFAGGALAALAVAMSASAAAQRPMSPKAVVNAFDQMAFFDHKPAEAVMKYFSPDFIEHDPVSPDGREALLKYMKAHQWDSNAAKDKIYRVIAEGDMVVVHHHVLNRPEPRGSAAVDIFRVKNGRIVEHWDVMQEVPAKAQNKNGML